MEPDLHLIKQVEQVRRLDLERPARRFARIPSMAITGAADPLISDSAIISTAWPERPKGFPRRQRTDDER
jgi:hypothetical protein